MDVIRHCTAEERLGYIVSITSMYLGEGQKSCSSLIFLERWGGVGQEHICLKGNLAQFRV